MAFFLVSFLYLVFLGILVFLRHRRRDTKVIETEMPGQALVQTEAPKEVTKEARGVNGVGINTYPRENIASPGKRYLSGITINIDPTSFNNSMVIEKDDEGGILIKCMPDSIVYNNSDEGILRSKEEIDNEFLKKVEELSASVREWDY